MYFTLQHISIWTSYISGVQQPRVASGYYIKQQVLEDPFLLKLETSQNTAVFKKIIFHRLRP